MKVVSFSEIEKSCWNQLCNNSNMAWMFHDASWIEIESKYFQPQNYSFGLIENNKLVAVQPLYFCECGLGTWSERILHSGYHRHAGLAMSSELAIPLIRAARSEAMRHIFALSEELDVDRVQLNAQNLAPLNLTARREAIPFWVLDYGFQLGIAFGSSGMRPAPSMSTCNADHIVELHVSEEDLFASLDESCRRAVRKAIASGVTFEYCEDEDAVDSYYEIAKISASRTGESLAPITYYEDVKRSFQSQGGCAILFAKFEKKRVAAIFLLIGKGSAHFLGGVSNPDYLIYRVNDFLHWSAITWCKNNNLSNYRLGPTFPEVPKDWLIAKVSKFKEKFGGRTHPVIQGSFFRHPEKYVDSAVEQIFITSKSHIQALPNNSQENILIATTPEASFFYKIFGNRKRWF